MDSERGYDEAWMAGTDLVDVVQSNEQARLLCGPKEKVSATAASGCS